VPLRTTNVERRTTNPNDERRTTNVERSCFERELIVDGRATADDIRHDPASTINSRSNMIVRRSWFDVRRSGSSFVVRRSSFLAARNAERPNVER